MAIRMTFHGETTKFGELTLDGQLADAVVVADGAVSDPVAKSGIYRIVATTPSLVRIGPDTITSATAGEHWPQNTVELRRIVKGQVVAVNAPA